jgi:hypothetical protein
VAAQLCGWVDEQLPNFTPWHAPGTTRPNSLQRFAELAIAYDVVERSPLHLPSLDAHWRPFIQAHVSSPAYLELARSRLDWAPALLLPYLVMRGRGDVNGYHDATLQESRRAGFPNALEVFPYRALDYAYFSRASGLDGGDSQAPEDRLAATFAGQVSCRYLVNSESAYALTHTVFYASSFGQSQVAPGHLVNAAPIVDSMIIDCCIRGHYDLLGELLIASCVLARCRPDIREQGLQIFLATLDASGSLLPDDEASVRSFERCYHTTMVGLILCASLAQATS